MSATDEEEARAEAWLRAQGYIPSRPIWLPPGQNPDFWSESNVNTPAHFWVEVKSIAPDDSVAAMDKYSDLIHTAQVPPGLRGQAMLHLESHAIEQSVRWVLKSFAKRSTKFVGQKVTLIFLQHSRNCDQEYRVDIALETPMVIWARSDELPLASATWFSGDAVDAPARVCAPDGSKITGLAYQFFAGQSLMECALEVRLNPQDGMLTSIDYMCGGSGRTRERTVNALETANSQIKTACATCEAPGLVILTPRGPFTDDDRAMQAAMYGQYTMPFRLSGEHVVHGELYHGPDGVFRQNKNTHISAAVHLRRQGPPTFFLNPYARHRLAENDPVFAGAVQADVMFA